MNFGKQDFLLVGSSKLNHTAFLIPRQNPIEHQSELIIVALPGLCDNPSLFSMLYHDRPINFNEGFEQLYFVDILSHLILRIYTIREAILILLE